MEFYLIPLILGLISGIFTGMLPGIHVNTITALLLSVTALGGFLEPVSFMDATVFICALSVVHTFFDVIPGLFLGVPGGEAYIMLPGHKLVKKGKGIEAVQLSAYGSFFGLLIGLTIMLLLLCFDIVDMINDFLHEHDIIFYAMIIVSIIIVTSEKNKILSFIIFMISGLFGVVTLGSPVIAGGADSAISSLVPVLVGMFGIAGILFSIITQQQNSKPRLETNFSIKKKKLITSSAEGTIAGFFVGLLPGVGAANAAIVVLEIKKKLNLNTNKEERDKSYMVSVSALNTSEAIFSIVALFFIEKSRSGASVALDKILGTVSKNDLLIIVVVFFVAGLLSIVIMQLFSKFFITIIHKLDERSLNWSVLLFLILLVYLLLNIQGLLLLCIAVTIGFLPLVSNSRRSTLMGFFMLPVILFYSEQSEYFYDFFNIGYKLSPSSNLISLPYILSSIIFSSISSVILYYFLRKKLNLHYSKKVAFGLAITIFLLPLVVLNVNRIYDNGKNEHPTAKEKNIGKISRVVDGDSIVLDSHSRRIKGRLYKIDAPELNQKHGLNAKAFLEKKISNKKVAWSANGVDHYGRLLITIYDVNDKNINDLLISSGHAWVYKYNRDDKKLILQEQQAKQNKLGLWQNNDAIPPWEWRRFNK